MTIELSKEVRAEAMASLKRYAEENLDGPMGDLPAGMLLDFMLEEIGPAIYNKAIEDTQERLQVRVADLSGELVIDQFQYWPRLEAKRKSRR